MTKFLVSYIEDNELGVYTKEILIDSESFRSAYEESIKRYPTMFALKQMFGEIEERWVKYWSHESQDLLRRSQLDMDINIEKMFGEKK